MQLISEDREEPELILSGRELANRMCLERFFKKYFNHVTYMLRMTYIFITQIKAEWPKRKIIRKIRLQKFAVVAFKQNSLSELWYAFFIFAQMESQIFSSLFQQWMNLMERR